MEEILLKLLVERFWKEEDGLGTLEILLIMAVLVAIAIVFRKWIVNWFTKLIGEANSNLKDNGSVTPCAPQPDGTGCGS
jgi:Flp pilus assembly pilin Flp